MKTFILYLKSYFSSSRLFISLFLLFPFSLLSQQTNYLEFWVKTSGTADIFFNNIVSAVNSNSDVYVAASELNSSGGYDILLSKFDKSGSEYWSATYNLTTNGDAIAGAITLDGNEDVIITGTAFNGSNNYDLFVAKFNSSGVELWNNTYNGAASFYDAGKAVVCDGNNIYVTGGSFENIAHVDMVTICYNSSGIQQWVSNFDHNSLHDGGATVGILNSTTLIVTGPTETSSNHWEYAAVQYNLLTGVEITSKVTIASGSTMDEFTALAIDENENVYLVGSVKDASTGFFDYKIFKLNSNLQILWEATYSGAAGKDDMAKAIGVDDSGNVYVSGFSTNNNGKKDYLTIKYNSSGTSQWTKKYDGGEDDEAIDLIVNSDNDIFVTGYTTKSGKQDFYTILYNESNGGELWSARNNGIYNKNDVAKDIELDADGNLLVSGKSEETTKTTYLTVKYLKHDIIIPPDDELLSTSFAYIENRGQLVDSAQNQVKGVKFYNQQKSPSLYFFDDQISFVVAKIDASTSSQDTMHRVDLGFVKSGRSYSSVMSINRKSIYHNYYLEHIHEGREEVPLYDRLIYPNVYNNIDLLLSSNEGGVKYYFICKPGSNPDSISLNFTGQSSLSISNGDLHVETSLEDIILPESSAYQINGNGDEVALSWNPSYSINGGEVSLTTSNYNSSQDLVISIATQVLVACGDAQNDNLRWGTLLGANNPSDAFSQSFESIEASPTQIYACGFSDDGGFPFLPGSNIGEYSDGKDAFILAFDRSQGEEEGTPLWGTFIGGSDVDEAKDLAVDNTGVEEKVYVVGKTQSSDFPHEDDDPDGWDEDNDLEVVDAFITRFSSAGALELSTYFGGGATGQTNISTAANVITIGDNGKIYIAGVGRAYGDMTFNGTFIARFSSGLANYEWRTQYRVQDPTDRTIETKDLVLDNNNNIFITGYHQESSGLTSRDAFIAKYAANAAINDLHLWDSIDVGGELEDSGEAIIMDTDNNPIICGKNTIEGSPTFDVDAFYRKYQNDGSSVLNEGTFGGENIETFYDVKLDGAGNIYFFGQASSPEDQLALVSSGIYYFQDEKAGNDDAFIISYSPAFSTILWSSYFGGELQDIGNSIDIKDGKIYALGNSSSRCNGTTGAFPNFPTRMYNDDSYYDDQNPFSKTKGFIALFDLNYVTGLIEETISSFEVLIYPNPSNGNLILETDIDSKTNLIIYDALGRVVYNRYNLSVSGKSQLDLNHLTAGIYFLTISKGKEIISRKISVY